MTKPSRLAAIIAILTLCVPSSAAPSKTGGTWSKLSSRLRGVEETYRKWGITFELKKDAAFTGAAGPMPSTLTVTGGIESSDTFALDVEAGLGNKNALAVVMSGSFKAGPDGNDLSGTGSLHLKGTGIGGGFKYTRVEGLVLETGLEETFYSLGVTIGGDGKSPISLGLKGGPLTIKVDPVKWVNRCRTSLPEMLKEAKQKIGGVLIRTDLNFLAAALASAPPPEVAQLRDVTAVSLKRLLPAAKAGKTADLGSVTTIIGLAYDSDAGDVLLLGRAEPGMAAIPVSTLVAVLRSIWQDGLDPYVSLDPGPDPLKPRLTPRIGGVSKGLEISSFVATMLEADYRIKSVIYGDTKVAGVTPVTEAIAQAKSLPSGVSARFWFAPRQVEPGDISVIRSSRGVLYTFDAQPLLITETTARTGPSEGIGQADAIEPILKRAAAQLSLRYPEMERDRPELGLKPLRQVFELALAASILRKEPPPAPCDDLLRQIASLPVPHAELRGEYVPVQKSVPVEGIPGGALLWGGVQATVDLRNAKFRTERSLAALFDRIQSASWSGASVKLKGAFDPVIANAETLNRAQLAEPHLEEAIRYVKANNLKQALSECDQALALTPDSVLAYLLRSAIHFTQRDIRSMFADAERAVQLAPKDARAYYWRGLANNEMHREAECLRDAEEAVRLSPTTVDFLLLRAAARRDLNDFDGAFADLDAALARTPRSSFVYFERGLTWRMIGKKEKAIEDFSAAIAINPFSVPSHQERAVLYMDLHDYPRALADYTRVAQIKPTSSNYSDLAGAKVVAGDYAGAIEAAEIALVLNARNPFGYMARGVAYQETGEYAKAIPDLEMTISLMPSMREPLQKRIDACKKALGEP